MIRESYESFATPAVEGMQTNVDIVEGGSGTSIFGYAVVWGAISSLRADGKRHRYDRGSIILAPTVLALWHHLAQMPLGSTQNNTLTITEDDIGLRVQIDLDDTTDGINTLKRVQNGLVRGMSFSGVRDPRDVAPTADPSVVRITRLVLDDITVTPTPSMTATLVTADPKNLEVMKDQKRREMNNQLNKFRLALIQPRGR